MLAVAAADSYDRPVVCSSGQPSAACASLVRQIADTGTGVRVHADFDPGGFNIVGHVHELGGTPWRMGAVDHEAALDRAGPRTVSGPVPVTPWDARLASEFAEHRRPVYEEQLLDMILQ